VRLLASRQTPKLEDHSWSAVHDCLLNIFAANLHIWHRSPYIVRAIKSRSLRWAGHVARMEESAFRIVIGKPTGLGVDGRTILEWTLKR
jgi:hypothetical protein